MLLVEILFTIVVAYAGLWAFYVVLLPVLASLGVMRPRQARTVLRDSVPSITVIVPAYNMQDFIGRCVESLHACNYPKDSVSVYIVTDHCTDKTASIALGAGASVLARDEGPRGKTYALAWAIEELAQRDIAPDLYVIVDATARVDPGFLTALAMRWMEGEDIIISRAVVDSENQQWFAQSLGLTLAHRNLQNRARERLGLSAFISGRGMAYSRNYIHKYGWTLALPTTTRLGAHPTEDWRHGVRIAEKGLRAAFTEDARVLTPLRTSLSAATEQGVRWERGRITNAFAHGWRLLFQGVRQRSLLKVIAALDAIQPPVAILVGLSVALGVFAAVVSGLRFGAVVGFVPLVLVSLYGIAVIVRGRREGIALKTVMWAPVYVAWRCMSFALALGHINRAKASGHKCNKV